MTDRPTARRFTTRPVDPERWIRDGEDKTGKPARPDFTARLTIDVTPEQRVAIKIAAFRRGVTVADMSRDLLAREFPQDEGESR